MMEKIAFTNCSLAISGKLVNKDLVFNDDEGSIIDIVEHAPEDATAIDLKGAIVSPGLLDLQNNGMIGESFGVKASSDAEYKATIDKICQFYVKHGATGLCPTVFTTTPEIFHSVLPMLAPQDFTDKLQSSILGAHVEGPFISEKKNGEHDVRLIKQEISSELLEQMYGSKVFGSIAKIITIAPENLGGLDIIKDIVQTGCVVSMGHSRADFSTAMKAVNQGASMITHLFNAMLPLHHRDPGIVGTIVAPNAPYFGIIADGVHLHPNVVNITYKSNPEKFVLVSDASLYAGMPDGTYDFRARKVRKSGDVIKLDGTDTLAGSAICIDACVRNLVKFAKCSLAEALVCATEIPAKCIGLTDRGLIKKGLRADFTVMDKDGNILQTWIGGKRAY